jgi:hypothetical protein
MAVPGALTFSGPRDVAAFTRLLDDLGAGRVQRVAFALPTSVTWALPLYELALMTGERVTTPPWWPPTKVAAPRLWGYLAPACQRRRMRRRRSTSCCSA